MCRRSGSQLESRPDPDAAVRHARQTALTMRSVIATLQDLGFTIDQADSELGTISATRLHHQYTMRMTVTVVTARGRTCLRAGQRAYRRKSCHRRGDIPGFLCRARQGNVPDVAGRGLGDCVVAALLAMTVRDLAQSSGHRSAAPRGTAHPGRGPSTGCPLPPPTARRCSRGS